jgi:transposase
VLRPAARRHGRDAVALRGRPVSQVTEDYLAWLCARLGAEGKTALLLVWDNASWHVSQRVRSWIKAHNRRAKAEGGVRIIACPLPIKAPWLNPIEPKWVHGKRAIVEPERRLTAHEVKDRVCQYYGCEQVEPLVQNVA